MLSRLEHMSCLLMSSYCHHFKMPLLTFVKHILLNTKSIFYVAVVFDFQQETLFIVWLEDFKSQLVNVYTA